MYIAAIETTGPNLSVAVINEKNEIKELVSHDKFNHLKNLVPMLDELLNSCNVKLSEAAAIAASVGPGSFTGIRIGVATARALAQALDVKTIPVPTLESFAYHVPEYLGAVCPVLDARRSQVYGGAFLWTREELEPSGEDATGGEKNPEPKKRLVSLVKSGAYDLDEFLSLLNQGMQFYGQREIMLFGDGMTPYGEKIAAWTQDKGYDFLDARVLERECRNTGAGVWPASSTQSAASVARMALDMYNEGKVCEYGELAPEYLRKAEAERKREERLQNE